MELDVLKLHTTWNDAANSINTNFSKIQMAIASLEGGGGGLNEDELRAFLVVYLAQNGYATRNDIDKAISEIVDGAPTALDTLKEIADALAQNQDEIGAIFDAISQKASKEELKAVDDKHSASIAAINTKDNEQDQAIADLVAKDASIESSITEIKGKDEEQDREIGSIEERLAKTEQITSLFGEDEDGNVYVKNSKNFYTLGEISAGGIGSESEEEGGEGGTLDSLLDVEIGDVVIDDTLTAKEQSAVKESQVIGYDNTMGLWINKKTMYIHNQSTATTVWKITHNLGKMPNVKVIDSTGALVYGTVVYDRDDEFNKVTISFGGAFSGRAYLD